MKRVSVFIDMQNVYLATQTVHGKGKINFTALRDYLQADKDSAVTMSIFTCYDPNNDGQRSFLTALGLLGYRVISKPLRKLPDGTIKANMDLEIAVEILRQAPYLDEIVLVSGDGDFNILVDLLCNMGKVVKVIGPDKLTSPELIQAAHHFVNLTSIPGILEDV